jgi:hypothetical protein
LNSVRVFSIKFFILTLYCGAGSALIFLRLYRSFGFIAFHFGFVWLYCGAGSALIFLWLYRFSFRFFMALSLFVFCMAGIYCFFSSIAGLFGFLWHYRFFSFIV